MTDNEQGSKEVAPLKESLTGFSVTQDLQLPSQTVVHPREPSAGMQPEHRGDGEFKMRDKRCYFSREDSEGKPSM